MIVRGVVVAFNSGAYTATIRYTLSISTVVVGVPVNRGIASADMAVGRKVAVALFDPQQPTDAMVLGVF